MENNKEAQVKNFIINCIMMASNEGFYFNRDSNNTIVGIKPYEEYLSDSDILILLRDLGIKEEDVEKWKEI